LKRRLDEPQNPLEGCGEEKNLLTLPEIEPDSSVVQPVAIPTELPRPPRLAIRGLILARPVRRQSLVLITRNDVSRQFSFVFQHFMKNKKDKREFISYFRARKIG
jgi:hypothetical protein